MLLESTIANVIVFNFYFALWEATFSRRPIVLTSGLASPVVSKFGCGVWRATCSAGPRLFHFFLANNHNHEKQDIGVRQKRTQTSDENAREHEEDIGPRQRRAAKNSKMKMLSCAKCTAEKAITNNVQQTDKTGNKLEEKQS